MYTLYIRVQIQAPNMRGENHCVRKSDRRSAVPRPLHIHPTFDSNRTELNRQRYRVLDGNFRHKWLGFMKPIPPPHTQAIRAAATNGDMQRESLVGYQIRRNKSDVRFFNLHTNST